MEQDALFCKCGCGLNVQPIVRSRLELLSKRTGLNLEINSGARCEAHNKAVGGSRNSDHIKQNAVDIFCVNAEERFKIVFEACFMACKMEKLISKIEVCNAHIHITFAYSENPILLWGISQ